MDEMNNFIGQELTWISTKFNTHFELHAGETVLATLDRDGRSNQATVEGAEGKLEIRQDSKLSPSTQVYSAGTDTPLANFQINGTGGGGTMEMANGRTFLWKNKMLLTSRKHVWMDAQNQELVHWEAQVFDGKVVAQIEPAAAALPELSLLVIVGLYITVALRQ
jgi:hypothetical protein